jgi:DNA-binding transcriptional regulator YiaG
MPWWPKSKELDGYSQPYHRGMATADAEEAIYVRDSGHLSDRDIAGATGAAPSAVREWLTGRSAPSGACAERLAGCSPSRTSG